MGAVSYCGRYKIRGATIGDAWTVLHDLSRDEREEAARLGITDMRPTFEQVAKDRAFAVTTTARPYKTLVIFGVREDGHIWLLPSQHCVDKHGRMLGNKHICRWFIDHCFELAGPKVQALYNGVTPDGKRIINWLTKCCGARFADKPVPTKHNGALALAFYIERPNNNV